MGTGLSLAGFTCQQTSIQSVTAHQKFAVLVMGQELFGEMMKLNRELIFRGFHPCDGPDTIVVDGEKVKGRWVEGNLVYVPDEHDFMCGAYIMTRLNSAQLGPERKNFMLGGFLEVIPSTVGQYTNIDVRREAWPQSEKHKIFTGDMLGEWGEDENGKEFVCVLGVVTYWEREGRYVLADENGLCNDWTLEDEAQPENWPHLIYCGTVFDEEADSAQT